MERSKPKIRRCAVYTRKSSEEGLEQEFNSLHAQREACDAFIRSQTGEGWRLIRTHYDDGGLSGATMERPALQRLMADIDKGLVDAVVVYKVDRLTRSLADFAKMVEVFDVRGVSFVAVTQQFNTTTSMGRLTLNVLLSFAQFEREVTGERIRDKIAASKRKGIWMGGLVPLGYEVRERQLVINEAEATTVRHIFTHYCELGSVRLLKEELDRDGVRSKIRVSKDGVESGGQAFSRGALYTLLRNPIYVGEIRHKGVCHPGQQAPIVDRAMWDKVAQLLRGHSTGCGPRSSSTRSCVLIGKLFDESGEGLTPSHAVKGDRRYRYYVSRSLMKGSAARVDGGWRLPAAEIERSVAAAAQSILDDQQTVVSAIEEAGLDSRRIAPLLKSAAVWSARLRFEQDNALSSLVDRVDLGQDVSATAGVIMMLFAVSSYPFPAEGRLVLFNWVFVLSTVGACAFVYFSMNRDRVLSLLSGTSPGKVSWNSTFVLQILTHGVLPILAVLGAAFPTKFGLMATWIGGLFGGHT